MKCEEITQAEVKRLFDYDPATGLMTRLTRPSYRNHIGDVVGSVSKHHGYLVVGIDSKTYLLHRIIWLWVHGALPKELDHESHIKTDNRLSNLREVTHKENGRNKSMPSTNKSGVIGVCWHKANNKWRAQIRANDHQNIHLGLFESIGAAAAARKAAEKKYGYHQNHGRDV